MTWNFGDILDAIAPVMPPDHPALIHGDRRISWQDFDARTNNLARALLDAGAGYGDKVAFYMRNRPEYMEALAACFKARLIHVNVNYRYQPDELWYIFDNSDARIIVYGEEFRSRMEALKERLPGVICFIEVASPGREIADFARPYEVMATDGDGLPLGVERTPDDLLFLYTGGTTGMPKGVMWPHGALREGQMAALRRLGPTPETLPELVHHLETEGPGNIQLPACPLMHGTGLFTAMGAIVGGGTVVTMEGEGFNATALWETVEACRINAIAIVGDAFAKPMLRALETAARPYDLSSIITVVSSGVMWSHEVKKQLLHFMPQAALVDSFGASEGLGFGMSVMTVEGEQKTARFAIGERCKVFNEQGEEVVPGSGEPGFIAVTGPIPMGYYKDEEKTATVFRTINGARWSIPGDWCTVETDGTLTLLGRGSVCINTGGEKVYPEEVEEVLKTHPHVEDTLVVGVPDERWGQAVTAVVRLAENAAFDEEALRHHVRDRLAGYKTPKRVLLCSIELRAPNGKADYKGAANFAQQALGQE